MRKIFKIFGYILGLGVFLTAIFYLVSWYGFQKERKDITWGVTFSTVMARQLELDPRKTFDAIVDDLGTKEVRLPVYWSDVEPQEGKFVFDDYDYFIKKSEERGVKLILAVGIKLPRWPECFTPIWAQFERRDQNQNTLRYIRTVVERYKKSDAIIYWQVENEPFHVYGSGCASGKISSGQVDKEITLLRSLDSRPILLTDSGEQGIWFSSLRRADVVGVSMYTQVWNDVFKVVRFPLGPGFYQLKKKFFSAFYPSKKIIVSELQAEPWGPSLLPGYDVVFQKELMNKERLQYVVSFARRTGFDTFYLWGVEWWYWLGEKQNDWSLWEEAKNLF